MLLTQMCSAELRKMLRMRKQFAPDLAAMRQEISDYLYDALPRGKGGRLAAVEETPGTEAAGAIRESADESEEPTPEETRRMLHLDPFGAMLSFYALVKKQNLKNKKGSKGKGGCKKGRTCFECGAEGHIAAACLVRVARGSRTRTLQQARRSDGLQQGRRQEGQQEGRQGRRQGCLDGGR